MKIVLLSILLVLTACGKDKTKSGCTEQNTNSNQVIVSCKTLRKENPGVCNRTTVNSQVESQNEICALGFDLNCAPVKIVPSAVKPNVDSGALVLKSKATGKKMTFKEITGASGDVFLIVQQEGDSGLTSTVDLPICSE